MGGGGWKDIFDESIGWHIMTGVYLCGGRGGCVGRGGGRGLDPPLEESPPHLQPPPVAVQRGGLHDGGHDGSGEQYPQEEEQVCLEKKDKKDR